MALIGGTSVSNIWSGSSWVVLATMRVTSLSLGFSAAGFTHSIAPTRRLSSWVGESPPPRFMSNEGSEVARITPIPIPEWVGEGWDPRAPVRGRRWRETLEARSIWRWVEGGSGFASWERCGTSRCRDNLMNSTFEKKLENKIKKY